MLRITVNKIHARITLEYSVLPKHFNPNPKQLPNHIRHGHKNHEKINRYLDKKINEAKDVTQVLKNEGKLINDIIKLPYLTAERLPPTQFYD